MVVEVAFSCENFLNFGAYFGLLGMNLGLEVVDFGSNFGVTDSELDSNGSVVPGSDIGFSWTLTEVDVSKSVKII